MSAIPKIMLFRGAMYRLALQQDISKLWEKRQHLLDLISSLGVKSASEEFATKYYLKEAPPETPFLPLKDGRSFVELVYELANRVAQTGYGETPAFFDQSADDLRAGINDALVGKLLPAIKEIRHIFDELKQHPEILKPKNPKLEAPKERRKTKKVYIPSQEQRARDIQLQKEFIEKKQRGGSTLPRTIRFRGALYTMTQESTPLPLIFKELVVGAPGAKHSIRMVLRRLKEYLLGFRASFRESDLVEIERLVNELMSMSETAVALLSKIMIKEHGIRKEYVKSIPIEEEHKKSMRRSKMVQDFFRLRKKDIIDITYLRNRGYSPDVDPRTLDDDKLADLLSSALEEEHDVIRRDRKRRERLDLPPPKRKIWKDKPEVAPPKPKGRPRIYD